MNPAARRPFWLALVVSLSLHLAVLTSPGWGLPLFDDDDTPPPLDASLTIPARAAPAPQNLPPPAKRPRPRPQPATPEVPVAGTPAAVPTEPAPAAEAAPEIPPEAPSPVAVENASTVVPAPTFAHADIWPKQGRIVFQVTRGGDGFIVGQAEHQWHHDGRQYELRATTETTGLAALFKPAQVIQQSRGGFSAAGILPQEFRTERDGKVRERLSFDYGAGRLTLTSGLVVAFPPGTQDMLSLFYQLGAYSLEDPRFAISISTGRKISYFMVTVGEVERLETPLGGRSVRHLKITGTAREDATDVWLDTQTRLPLKIRHRDRKGELFDQIAATIELDKTP